MDAYWIGNSLLGQVAASPFYELLRSRFRSRMDGRSFDWLVGKLGVGAMPHHNFHIYDVYTRGGLMNDSAEPILLQTLHACRVSWGAVVAVEGDHLLIRRPPLVLAGGRLALGEPRPERVTRQVNGLGLWPTPGRAIRCRSTGAGPARSWRPRHSPARARSTQRCLALATLTV